MKSAAHAACAAPTISSSDAPGEPKRMLSRMLPEKSTVSCGTMEILLRREASLRSFTSVPSTVTLPEVASYSRGTRSTREVFPEPVAPRTATTLPGSIARSMSSSTGSEPGPYLNDTFSNTILQGEPSCSSTASGASHTSGTASSTSAIRRDEAIPFAQTFVRLDIMMRGVMVVRR